MMKPASLETTKRITSYENKSLFPVLSYVLTYKNIRKYLEIGTREGGSLYHVLTYGPFVSDCVIADNWSNESGGTGRGNHRHIAELLKEIEYSGRIKFLDGDSSKTIPLLEEYDFELSLVDGNHSLPALISDMNNVWERLSCGGVMVVDDLDHTSHPGIRASVTEFLIQNPDAEIFHVNNEYPGTIALEKLL
jgi:hypothetical protein